MQPEGARQPAAEAFFADVGGSRRLCILHSPGGRPPKAQIVYVHPFAEELNKTRRMAALQSRALASAGYAVLQIDLYGCGDSDGEFEEATWDRWVQDVAWAVQWLRQRHDAPLWLWGLRAGALLAGQASASLDEPHGLLLWQPAVNGAPLLQQFLRIRAMGQVESGAKGGVGALKHELASGRIVDVAGYRLSPAIASGMEAARLSPANAVRRIEWLEVTSRDPAELLPASAASLASWEERGLAMQARAVPGPPFWQTIEIEVAPALLEATCGAMNRAMGEFA